MDQYSDSGGARLRTAKMLFQIYLALDKPMSLSEIQKAIRFKGHIRTIRRAVNALIELKVVQEQNGAYSQVARRETSEIKANKALRGDWRQVSFGRYRCGGCGKLFTSAGRAIHEQMGCDGH